MKGLRAFFSKAFFNLSTCERSLERVKGKSLVLQLNHILVLSELALNEPTLSSSGELFHQHPDLLLLELQVSRGGQGLVRAVGHLVRHRQGRPEEQLRKTNSEIKNQEENPNMKKIFVFMIHKHRVCV